MLFFLVLLTLPYQIVVTEDVISITTTDNINSVFEDDDPCNDLDLGDSDGVLCRSHKDCEVFNQYCCETENKRICVKSSIKATISPATHTPLLGVIPRECPEDPIPEPFAVRNCSTDIDCWPRICCPDGNSSYCRTPQPPWQKLPMQRLFSPLRNMMAYMQCTPPPPPHYDLFPKECRTTLDCFPNLCCQEKDRKICRPPRKSLLALISVLGTR